jgi:glutathione S-transferase
MLTLYMSPGSSSMAPHIAMHEIGVPFEARWISFGKQEQRTPEYLALNPEGKVPALIVGGRALTEVAAVLYYLARSFPAADLGPAGNIDAEAQIISWMSFIAATVHPARRAGRERSVEVFEIADKRLGDRDWAVGSSYSIADIHLFRLNWRFVGSFGPHPDAFSNLTRHYDRMMARPAVQRTLQAESAVGYELPA